MRETHKFFWCCFSLSSRKMIWSSLYYNFSVYTILTILILIEAYIDYSTQPTMTPFFFIMIGDSVFNISAFITTCICIYLLKKNKYYQCCFTVSLIPFFASMINIICFLVLKILFITKNVLNSNYNEEFGITYKPFILLQISFLFPLIVFLNIIAFRCSIFSISYFNYILLYFGA